MNNKFHFWSVYILELGQWRIWWGRRRGVLVLQNPQAPLIADLITKQRTDR